AASVTLSLFLPVLIGKAVDCAVGIGAVNYPALAKILLIFALTAALSALFQWLMTQCVNRAAYQTVHGIRVDLFHRLNAVPLKYIDGNARGDLLSRLINDAEQITDGLLQGLTRLFNGVITIAGTLLLMLSMNRYIAAVVIVLTPLSLLIAAAIAKRGHKLFTLQTRTHGELSGLAEEILGGHKTVKAAGYEAHAQQAFDEINARLYGCGVEAQFYSSLTNPATRFVNGVVFAAVGITGALGAIGGMLTIGQIASFLTYAGQYAAPFNEISDVAVRLQSAAAGAERVFAVIDEPTEADDSRNKTITRCEGRVSLKDVAFSYQKDVPLIQGLHLTVKPGERVAIVGPTGSGKTTIINLLMRFYDADAGEIRVDGENIKNVTRNSLRGLYGMVLQDTWLFRGTIRDNIAYAKPNATAAEVETAAHAASAHGFITRLPHGYQTIISGDGGNLSRGQTQLLCVARVMLANPSMLILDEATSSVDTLTERRIQEAFAKLTEGRTSFIVAHRLSTIRGADTILVTRDGRIAEQGNHDALMKKRGFYYRLSGAE
ncbi:MAG: ABC transporter ATP-binding protein/permease, partial [Clostridiales bacterium]|nr:ABC transporter ATP-binding protein/permease [Clostridiales bacterium]